MGLLRTVTVIGVSFEDSVIGLSFKNNDYYRTAIKKTTTLTAISLPFKNSNYKFRRVSSIGLPFIKRCCPWIAITEL